MAGNKMIKLLSKSVMYTYDHINEMSLQYMLMISAILSKYLYNLANIVILTNAKFKPFIENICSKLIFFKYTDKFYMGSKRSFRYN